MKTFSSIIIVFALLFSGSVMAQNNEGKADDAARISITPQVSDQKIPSGAKKLLLNKMKQICAKNGMAGDGANPFFVMDASIDIISKDLTATAPPMHALNMTVNLYIKDANGAIFSETSYEAKGVGTNETKAYIAGIKAIKTNSGQFKAMVERGKTKILEFYNSQCDFIISKAKALHKQGNNGEAIKVLESVPPVSKECYDMCMELLSEIEPPVEQAPAANSGSGAAPAGGVVAPAVGLETTIDTDIFLVYVSGKQLGDKTILGFEIQNRGTDDYELNDYAYDTRVVDGGGNEFNVEAVETAGKKGSRSVATVMSGTPVPLICHFDKIKSVAMFEFKYKGRTFRLKNLPVGETAAATSAPVQGQAQAASAAPVSTLAVNSKVFMERDGETRFQYKEYAPGKIKTVATSATKGEYEVMAISDCSSDVRWTGDIIMQWHDATANNIKEGMLVLYTFYGNAKSPTVCYNIGKVVALDEMYKNLVTIKGYSGDIKKVDFNKVLIVDKSSMEH